MPLSQGSEVERPVLQEFPFVHDPGHLLPPPGGGDLGALDLRDSVWVRVVWGLGGCLLLVYQHLVSHLVLSVLGPPVPVGVFLLLCLSCRILLLGLYVMGCGQWFPDGGELCLDVSVHHETGWSHSCGAVWSVSIIEKKLQDLLLGVFALCYAGMCNLHHGGHEFFCLSIGLGVFWCAEVCEWKYINTSMNFMMRRCYTNALFWS